MSKRSIAAVVALAALGLAGIAAGVLLFSDGDRRIGAFEARGPTEALALRLDGVWLPGLRSVDGCRAAAPVVKTRVANAAGAATVNKHLGGVKVAPCVLRLQLGNGQVGLLRWIRDMLAGQPQRKDLTLVAPNPSTGRQGTSLGVEEALISSVRFPALNAATSEAAELELTVVPEQLTRTDYGASGSSMPPTPSSFRATTVSNFVLTMAGIQDAGFAVRAAPLTVEQKLTEYAVGDARAFQYEPSEVEIGDWSVTLPTNRLTQFNSWFQSFVLDGLNGANQEKTGSLEMMAYSATDSLFTLNFTGLGLFDADDVAGTTPGRSYSLYVEGVTMTVGPPVATGTTTTGTTATGTTATTGSTTTGTTTTGSTTTGTTTTTEEPPAAPVELRATLTEKGGVALEWAPVDEAEGYVILKSREPGGDYAEVARSEGPTVVVETLEGVPPYYFVVRAIRGDIQSANSAEVAVKG